ncbi:MAG: hypothetical protein ABIR26_03650, partial [Ramlibacter sp.]
DVSSSLDLRVSLMAHAAGGLVVLIAATAFAIYKPTGLLPWARAGAEVQGSTATPRWVKGVLVVAGALIAALLAMLLIGHGPVMHVHR